MDNERPKDIEKDTELTVGMIRYLGHLGLVDATLPEYQVKNPEHKDEEWKL